MSTAFVPTTGHAVIPVTLVDQDDATFANPTIASIIHRIEEVIDSETAGIRGNIEFDIRASNARKSRYLYELNRAMKGVSPRDLGERHRDDIIRLKDKLAANEEVLQAHLSAVSEVARIVQDAVEHAENDGTYTSVEARGSRSA